MMIKFDDVRIEKELTYLFISSDAVNLRNVEWCFKQAGITDYKIHDYTEFNEVLPAGIKIPEVKSMPLPEWNRTELCKDPNVIISHMNTDDLFEKICEIIRSNDEDLIAYKEEERRKSLEDYRQNYYMYTDGQIPVAAK